MSSQSPQDRSRTWEGVALPLLIVAAILGAAIVASGLTTQEMPRSGWPTEVTPERSREVGSVIVAGRENFGMFGGLEGNQPFIRAVNEGGDVVLEQHFEWPGTKQWLPAGDYVVTVYAKGCNGWCDNLSGQIASCSERVSLADGDVRTITVRWRRVGMPCRVDNDA